MPNNYVERTSPIGTTSATLEDVSGMALTVTLDTAAEICVLSAFELATQSGASASTIAIAVSIDGVDHDEMSRYLSGSSDTGIGAIVHRSDDVLAAGDHTIKLRFRRASGVSTPGINHAHMVAFGMQGAVGPMATVGDRGDKTALSTDSPTTLLEQTLSLGNSGKFVGTITARVAIWLATANGPTKVGETEATVTAYVETDAFGVATVQFTLVPVFDTDRLGTALSGSDFALEPSTGGFTIYATRPTGVACYARAEWWIRKRDGTDTTGWESVS